MRSVSPLVICLFVTMAIAFCSNEPGPLEPRPLRDVGLDGRADSDIGSAMETDAAANVGERLLQRDSDADSSPGGDSGHRVEAPDYSGLSPDSPLVQRAIDGLRVVRDSARPPEGARRVADERLGNPGGTVTIYRAEERLEAWLEYRFEGIEESTYEHARVEGLVPCGLPLSLVPVYGLPMQEMTETSFAILIEGSDRASLWRPEFRSYLSVPLVAVSSTKNGSKIDARALSASPRLLFGVGEEDRSSRLYFGPEERRLTKEARREPPIPWTIKGRALSTKIVPAREEAVQCNTLRLSTKRRITICQLNEPEGAQATRIGAWLESEEPPVKRALFELSQVADSDPVFGEFEAGMQEQSEGLLLWLRHDGWARVVLIELNPTTLESLGPPLEVQATPRTKHSPANARRQVRVIPVIGLEHPSVVLTGFAGRMKPFFEGEGNSRFHRGRNIVLETDRSFENGFEYNGPSVLVYKQGCWAVRDCLIAP